MYVFKYRKPYAIRDDIFGFLVIHKGGLTMGSGSDAIVSVS